MTSLTYQNIVNIIRQVASLVNPDGWFEHARKWDFSLSYDKADPQILLYPFTIKGKESRQSEILIGFFKQDTPETTPEQREIIIAAMDVLARAFIESLDGNETIEILNYSSEPAYRYFSGTYSGYLVKFTLNGALDCEDTPIPSACPDLCELIGEATTNQIIECLSDEQELEMIEELCAGGVCEYNVTFNGNPKGTITAVNCEDIFISLT